MGGKLGGSRLSPPSLTLPLFSKIPQDLVIEQKRYFPQIFCILFYIIGMVGGLICDECECIECVIRQMFSFPDHSGCMSSMALMFHSQWYLSLTIFTNAFPSQKMKCLFLPRSVPVPIFISTFLFPALLQACDLIFWTIDGNLALFQWLPPLSGWRLVCDHDQTPPHRHQAWEPAETPETKFASSTHLRLEILTRRSDNSYYLASRVLMSVCVQYWNSASFQGFLKIGKGWQRLTKVNQGYL